MTRPPELGVFLVEAFGFAVRLALAAHPDLAVLGDQHPVDEDLFIVTPGGSRGHAVRTDGAGVLLDGVGARGEAGHEGESKANAANVQGGRRKLRPILSS